MPFSNNALAAIVDTLVEEATFDLPFTNVAQMEADFRTAKMAVRARLNPLVRILALTFDGDPLLAEPDDVDALKAEIDRFERDPDGYLDDHLGATPIEPNETVAAPLVTSQVPTSASAPTHTPAQSPIPQVAFIDRPASALFKNLGPTFAGTLVPCPRWVGPSPANLQPDPHYAFDGLSIQTLATAMRLRRNVIATGDPGCGKTEFFKQFGATIGMPVHKIPLDGSITRPDLIGSFRQIATATGSETPFVDGLIPRLIQTPCILIFDEIDQADPDIQYLLHPVYEGSGLTILEDGGRFVPRHEHCYIVATANTKGRGSSNGLTHCRFEMSEATRERFTAWLNFTYLEESREQATIVAKTGLRPDRAKELVAVATLIRDGYKTGVIAQPCSLRQLLDVAEFAEDMSSLTDDVALALACDMVLAGRANPEDQTAIRAFIRQTMAVDLETLELA